jgi:hypothetical protein
MLLIKRMKKNPKESVTVTASYNVCSMLVSQRTWRRCGCSIEKSQHATSEQKSTAPKRTEKECANPNDDVSIKRTSRSMWMRYKYVQIRADDRLLEAHKCKLQTPHATYLIVYLSIRKTYKYVFFSVGPWCVGEVLCFVCACFYWRHFAKKRN